MTTNENKGDKEAVRTSVEPSLKRQIRVEAAKQDESMSEYVRGLLRDWADRQDSDVSDVNESTIDA